MGGGGADGGGGAGKEGGWECSGCHNWNHAFRSFCNHCKQPQFLVDTKTSTDSKWLPWIRDWIRTDLNQLASPTLKRSWADMAPEDELVGEEEIEESNGLINVNNSSAEGTSMVEAKLKVALSRDQREYVQFYSIQRKADFVCLERVKGKILNILDGLDVV